MRLVVLTGGIACGKSTVSKMLAEQHHVAVLDSDKIAHDQQKPGTEVYKQIVEHFGEEILNDDKKINSKKLGSIIFADHQERRVLNRITHGPVIKHLLKQSMIHWLKRTPILVLEIPLFFESGLPKWLFDDIITVSIGMNEQIDRLMKRNNFSKDIATQRINSQLSLDEKCKLSTIVVDNRGDLDELQSTVNNMVLNWKNHRCTRYPDPLLILFIIMIIIISICYLRK